MSTPSIVIIRLQYQESGSGAGETRVRARSRWGLRLARSNLARRLQALGSLTSALVQLLQQPGGGLPKGFKHSGIGAFGHGINHAERIVGNVRKLVGEERNV